MQLRECPSEICTGLAWKDKHGKVWPDTYVEADASNGEQKAAHCRQKAHETVPFAMIGGRVVTVEVVQ